MQCSALRTSRRMAACARRGALLIRDRHDTCFGGPGSATHHSVLRCARDTRLTHRRFRVL